MKIEMSGVSRTFSKKYIVITLLQLVLGGIAFYGALYFSASSWLYHLLMCAGIFLIGMAIVEFFTKRYVYINNANHREIIYRKLELKTSGETIDQVLNAIKQGDMSYLKKQKDEISTNMIVDVAYTDDDTFGAIRISEYQGYSFQEVLAWQPIDTYSMKLIAQELKLKKK